MTIEFLSWNWRGGLNDGRLVAAIARFTGGPVYAHAVDSGTDDYVVALADTPVTQVQAQQAWDRHVTSG